MKPFQEVCSSQNTGQQIWLSFSTFSRLASSRWLEETPNLRQHDPQVCLEEMKGTQTQTSHANQLASWAWTAWRLHAAGPASAPEELDGAHRATTEPRGRAGLLRQELELLRCVFEEVAIPPFLSAGKCRLCFFPGNTLIFSTAQFSVDRSWTVYLSNIFTNRAYVLVAYGDKNPTDILQGSCATYTGNPLSIPNACWPCSSSVGGFILFQD